MATVEKDLKDVLKVTLKKKQWATLRTVLLTIKKYSVPSHLCNEKSLKGKDLQINQV